MPKPRNLLPRLMVPAVACALTATVTSGVVTPVSASAPTQPHATVAAARRAPVDINVGSFNIQSAGHDRSVGLQRPWRKRRATVVRQILANRIDVLGVQEAAYTPSFRPRLVTGRTQYLDLRNGLNSLGGRYAVTVKAAVNCKRPYVAANCRRRDRNASAADRIIYNKRALTVVRTGARKYSRQTSRTPNMALAWAVLRSRATGARFLFTTTHLDPSNRRVRRAQWRQMIRIVKQVRRGLPVVSVGDFNVSKMDPMTRTMLPAMRKAGFGDVLNQSYGVNPTPNVRARTRINGWMNTYNHLTRRVASFGYEDRRGNTGNGIDWIFASNHLPIMEYEVVCAYDTRTLRVTGTLPSDHNMIRAKVRLP
jgi:endonuclease/exonuclease/phosphatase family metal-dependent hydrolase